jgi:hypothetical protein
MVPLLSGSKGGMVQVYSDDMREISTQTEDVATVVSGDALVEKYTVEGV